MLPPQSPFSKLQLHFSLNTRFHGFNYQFYVVNFQISLPALTLTESSLCHVLKLSSGSMVVCPGESTGWKWDECIGLVPPLLPLSWVACWHSVSSLITGPCSLWIRGLLGRKSGLPLKTSVFQLHIPDQMSVSWLRQAWGSHLVQVPPKGNKESVALLYTFPNKGNSNFQLLRLKAWSHLWLLFSPHATFNSAANSTGSVIKIHLLMWPLPVITTHLPFCPIPPLSPTWIL